LVCPLGHVARPRIFLDVEPRLLRDALEEVLDSVGVDEVLVLDDHAADRSPMSFDAAIVTLPSDDVHADVVIELRTGHADSVGHVTAGLHSEDVALRTPQQLLSLLDRLFPSPVPRIAPSEGAHG